MDHVVVGAAVVSPDGGYGRHAGAGAMMIVVRGRHGGNGVAWHERAGLGREVQDGWILVGWADAAA
jgi:hypothetical protein